MPIKDNLNNSQVKVVLNTEPLINGNVDSLEFSYPLLKRGSDLGITFIFSVAGLPTGITTISIFQATSPGGSFTTIPAASLITPSGLTMPAVNTAFNEDVLRVGLLGSLGPYFIVRAANTAAVGAVSCYGIIGIEGMPI